MQALRGKGREDRGGTSKPPHNHYAGPGTCGKAHHSGLSFRQMGLTGSMEIVEGSPSTLALVAGYLAGRMDRRFNTGTQWTTHVYMDMQAGKLTLDYLYRLERAIALRWPERERPPKASDCISPSL